MRIRNNHSVDIGTAHLNKDDAQNLTRARTVQIDAIDEIVSGSIHATTMDRMDTKINPRTSTLSVSVAHANGFEENDIGAEHYWAYKANTVRDQRYLPAVRGKEDESSDHLHSDGSDPPLKSSKSDKSSNITNKSRSSKSPKPPKSSSSNPARSPRPESSDYYGIGTIPDPENLPESNPENLPENFLEMEPQDNAENRPEGTQNGSTSFATKPDSENLPESNPENPPENFLEIEPQNNMENRPEGTQNGATSFATKPDSENFPEVEPENLSPGEPENLPEDNPESLVEGMQNGATRFSSLPVDKTGQTREAGVQQGLQYTVSNSQQPTTMDDPSMSPSA
jgi:hypothetical protein